MGGGKGEKQDLVMFYGCAGVADDEAAIRSIKSAFTLLPLRNLRTIKALSFLQYKVASYSEENKMVPSNLAIVFSPSLFRSSAEMSGGGQ